MGTKKDITSRGDIEQLVAAFYEQVKKDDTIGFIFTDVAKINWDHHIPLIVNFWESILLDNPVYTKNAMEVHYVLNKKMPLQKAHFAKWVLLFCTAVDDLFEGKIAALAKTRAKSIAALMQFKMADANK
ncbi:group III truncated hemoglobin [Ferruginibacter paludis]|uniref:group III truncated hemoglobin n=1 Tax=Ferruginibacter paludis TaxID=1310417 RepID=UPI0025B356F4|nr:group III truncated hemoglobin [Ferruginibacter paludis]MDN3654453.1 group III truncated hemoglobin [Ferruginibacter paludis]